MEGWKQITGDGAALRPGLKATAISRQNLAATEKAQHLQLITLLKSLVPQAETHMATSSSKHQPYVSAILSD